MNLSHILYLISSLAVASCRIYSVENADGSYSIGHNSDSRSETANSVLALLTKAAGYTINQDFETQPPAQEYQEPETKQESIFLDHEAESRISLSPHLEILDLVQVFLQFKAELGSRIYALVSDNFDLIRSVTNTLVSKVGTLHSFTVIGIKILRQVLQLAVSLMAQWQINVPPVSVDFNVGSPGLGEGTSFHFNKNGNIFGGSGR